MSDAIRRLVADVRQPLTSVIGRLELALEAIGDVPDLPTSAAGHASLRAVRDYIYDARAASRDVADLLSRGVRDGGDAKAPPTPEFGSLLDATATLDEYVCNGYGSEDPHLSKLCDAVWRLARQLAGQELPAELRPRPEPAVRDLPVDVDPFPPGFPETPR